MTAPLKPAGRTLAEFQPLKPAERKLLGACRQGAEAHISAERPEAASDDNIVRAAFLRFLALGGDEHRLRKANLIGQTPKEWGKLRSWLYRNASRGGHWLFWVFTGYGYRPLRLLGWMFGVWLVCAVIYWYAAAGQGVFAPSNPLVFQNPNYAVCAPGYVAPTPQSASTASPAIQGAGNWYLCEKLPEEYSGFSPLAYSLDVILPLVDLQQEAGWAPLIPTPKAAWYQELLSIFDWKHFTRLVLWFEILFGWVSSLLLVAVVSGLTKRREE